MCQEMCHAVYNATTKNQCEPFYNTDMQHELGHAWENQVWAGIIRSSDLSTVAREPLQFVKWPPESTVSDQERQMTV